MRRAFAAATWPSSAGRAWASRRCSTRWSGTRSASRRGSRRRRATAITGICDGRTCAVRVRRHARLSDQAPLAPQRPAEQRGPRKPRRRRRRGPGPRRDPHHARRPGRGGTAAPRRAGHRGRQQGRHVRRQGGIHGTPHGKLRGCIRSRRSCRCQRREGHAARRRSEPRSQTLLPVADRLYPEEDLTDRDERFLAAEFIREKIFRLLGDEVPYATTVAVDKFEHGRRDLRRIHATVYVDKPRPARDTAGRGRVANEGDCHPRARPTWRSCSAARCSSRSGCA